MTDIDEIRAKAQAKQTLLAQARELGLEVDKRWSVETLAEKVVEAQFMAEETAAQKIHDESDTWVCLLRGAWPTSERKHMAGEVIKVPEWMAEQWSTSGAARLAMKSEIPAMEPA